MRIPQVASNTVSCGLAASLHKTTAAKNKAAALLEKLQECLDEAKARQAAAAADKELIGKELAKLKREFSVETQPQAADTDGQADVLYDQLKESLSPALLQQTQAYIDSLHMNARASVNGVAPTQKDPSLVTAARQWGGLPPTLRAVRPPAKLLKQTLPMDGEYAAVKGLRDVTVRPYRAHPLDGPDAQEQSQAS